MTLAGSKVRMENPRLSGFRQGTRGYEVTADAALQDVRKPSQIELQQMRGHIATDDQGGIARLSAASGLFDTAREAPRSEGRHPDLDRQGRGGAAALRRRRVQDRLDQLAGTRHRRRARGPTVKADTLDVVENGKRISFVGNVHVVIANEDQAEKPQARILTSDAEAADGAR
ncbi:hypothetical protein ACU4GR_19295 [Methylobacterium oryzae CBMB20]